VDKYSILFELWDEDSTFKGDNDDLIGKGKVEDLEIFKKKKGVINVKVKNFKEEETGEINIEIELDDKYKGEEEVKEEGLLKGFSFAGAKSEVSFLELDTTTEKKEEGEEKKQKEGEEKKRKEEEKKNAKSEKKKEKEEEKRQEKEKKERENDEKIKIRNDKKKEGRSSKKNIEEERGKEISKDTLKVRVIDAKFYEKQDIFGMGDPYVIVKFNNEEFKTKTYHNTKTATYNEGIFKLILNIYINNEYIKYNII
jgi:outer membrane biosynthesis protein TonB